MYYIKSELLIKMQIATLQEHTLNKVVPWFRVCIIYFILQRVVKPVTVEKEKHHFYLTPETLTTH